MCTDNDDSELQSTWPVQKCRFSQGFAHAKHSSLVPSRCRCAHTVVVVGTHYEHVLVPTTTAANCKATPRCSKTLAFYRVCTRQTQCPAVVGALRHDLPGDAQNRYGLLRRRRMPVSRQRLGTSWLCLACANPCKKRHFWTGRVLCSSVSSLSVHVTSMFLVPNRTQYNCCLMCEYRRPRQGTAQQPPSVRKLSHFTGFAHAQPK